MAHMRLKAARPSEDPILKTLTVEPEPRTGEVLKDVPADESAAGTPAAGRSALREVTPRHPLRFLHLLGPGLITVRATTIPVASG